jgi:hypothetical protein
MRVIKTVLFVLLALLILLAAGEIYLRLIDSRKLQNWSAFAYQPDTALGYRYLPLAKGIYRNAAYTRPYVINYAGFPGNEFTEQKPRGIYRILLVGTSDDTGLCTNGPLNYCNLVNAAFKDHGLPVQLVNLSIDGSRRSEQCLRLIRMEGQRLGAGMVLLCNSLPFQSAMRYRSSYKGVTINYARPAANLLDSAHAFIDTAVLIKDNYIRLYDHLYLYRYLAKAMIEHKESAFVKWVSPLLFKDLQKFSAYARKLLYWSKKGDTAKYPPTICDEATSIDSLKHLNRFLAVRHIKLLTFDSYQRDRDLQPLFGAAGLDYCALGIPRRSAYTFGELDRHSSQDGHKAIATALFRQLMIRVPQGEIR